MSITFVQASTPTRIAGEQIPVVLGTDLSISNTITGVAAGNSLIVLCCYGFFPTSWSGVGGALYVDTHLQTSFAPGGGPSDGNTVGIEPFHLANMPAGDHTITMTFPDVDLSGVHDVFVDPILVLLEYSGIDTSFGISGSPTAVTGVTGAFYANFISVSNSGTFDFARWLVSGIMFPPAHANPNQAILSQIGEVPLLVCFDALSNIPAAVDNDSAPPPASWTERTRLDSSPFSFAIYEGPEAGVAPTTYTGFNRAAALGSAVNWGGTYSGGSLAPFSFTIQAHSVALGLPALAGGGVDVNKQHLQADFLPPYPADQWRGMYDAQYCLEANYPTFTTPEGSPVPGDTFRIRFLSTIGGQSYYARIRTVDLDGTLGEWRQGGPFLVGSDVPPGGPTGGGTDILK